MKKNKQLKDKAVLTMAMKRNHQFLRKQNIPIKGNALVDWMEKELLLSPSSAGKY
jgi:hypothetical protein